MHPTLARCGRLSYLPIIGIGLAVATWFVYRGGIVPIVLAAWLIAAATVLRCLYAFVRRRRAPVLSRSAGRTVAIVTAHERDTEDLHACVWSILNQQGVLVEEVHVVDAGSIERPVQPFAHPRVRWHRTGDRGRHAAQVYVLDRLELDDWDFVLIVDSDCVLADDAMEHQLRALSRPSVTATTGMMAIRNARQNLLTRVAEMNVGASYAMLGMDRSPARTLKIPAGAPFLYRARIVLQYRRRYLAAGAYGDERRLAMYAALEGDVVAVRETAAWALAPTDPHTAYRQRLRWSTAWWYLVPLTLTRVDRPRGPAGRLLALSHLVVGPLTIAYAVVAMAVSAGRGTLRWPTVALCVALYLLVRYAATGLYLTDRPEPGGRRRLWTWLLLTPAEAACNLVFVLPIKYASLLKLRWRAWETWRDRGAFSFDTPTADTPTASPGTVYYAGYLPEGEPLMIASSATTPGDQRGTRPVEQQGDGCD